MITGTLINAGAIIIGSIIGIVLNKKFPRNINTIIFQALGLFSIFLGLSLAFQTQNNYLIICLSLILGGVVGESFKLSKKTDNLGELFKRRLNNSNPRFTEGFVTATMIFSVGSMAIIGPLNEALIGDATLVLTKSMMDGVTSIALSAVFGRGVIFSAIPVLFIQGSIGLGATSLQSFLSEELVAEISSIGGILILGIGISLLEIKKINVINLLPSMLIIIPLFYLMNYMVY